MAVRNCFPGSIVAPFIGKIFATCVPEHDEFPTVTKYNIFHFSQFDIDLLTIQHLQPFVPCFNWQILSFSFHIIVYDTQEFRNWDLSRYSSIKDFLRRRMHVWYEIEVSRWRKKKKYVELVEVRRWSGFEWLTTYKMRLQYPTRATKLKTDQRNTAFSRNADQLDMAHCFSNSSILRLLQSFIFPSLAFNDSVLSWFYWNYLEIYFMRRFR